MIKLWRHLRHYFLLYIGIMPLSLVIILLVTQWPELEAWYQIALIDKNGLDIFSKLGDAIGGILGSALTFASILFLIDSINTQRIESKNQRKEFFENKLLDIIQKEFEFWNIEKEIGKLDTTNQLIPYQYSPKSYLPLYLKHNFIILSKPMVIDCIKVFNNICFRIYILLYNLIDNTQKKHLPFTPSEIDELLLRVGSLFEITQMYGYVDVFLTYSNSKEVEEGDEPTIEILNKCITYIYKLSQKIFETDPKFKACKVDNSSYQLNEYINERIFKFYGIKGDQKVKIDEDLKMHQKLENEDPPLN